MGREMSAPDRAMDKLRDEMAGKDAGPGITALGEYLTERLLREPGIAEMILEKGKTLKGAFLSIKDEARKRQKGGFAYVGPEEAFSMTCKYFGIPEEKIARAAEGEGVRAIPQALAHSDYDELDLDALMDG